MYGYDPIHIWDEISMFLIISSKISFNEYKTQRHDIQTSNKFFYTFEPTMCMDEIQNTYKPYKFALMKSNHET